MNLRQQQLLNEIIVRYTETALPVSSLQLADAGSFDVSPATIRNDMAVLEAEGYITQPHTSSGRIPTEKGYRYFIQHSLQEKELAGRQRQTLEDVAAQRQQPDVAMRELAKAVAQVSSLASFVAAEPGQAYVTGFGNLLAQPEFSHNELARELAATVDRFDELLERLFGVSAENISILIGAQNPVSRNCATVLLHYRTRHGQGLVGLFGPVRMDYERNSAILRHASHVIHEMLD